MIQLTNKRTGSSECIVAPCFLQCFDAVGWVPGRAFGATHPWRFLSGTDGGRGPSRELADPSPPGK